jgi:hypothetical protein
MRALPLIAVVLAVTACGKNQQAQNQIDTGDQLSADSIVANDVTAIDAVTGAAANMAADVDVNYGAAIDANAGAPAVNDAAKKPASSPASKRRAPTDADSNSAATAPANTVTNAE